MTDLKRVALYARVSTKNNSQDPETQLLALREYAKARRLEVFAEYVDVGISGSKDYSQEELVAEMGSAFLCGHCGIAERIIDNSAAYIQGWLRRLRNDKRLVVFAAAQAHKAADFVLGTTFDS